LILRSPASGAFIFFVGPKKTKQKKGPKQGKLALALVLLLGALLTSFSCYAFLPAYAAPQTLRKAILESSDSAQFLQELSIVFLSNISSPLRADQFYILNLGFKILHFLVIGIVVFSNKILYTNRLYSSHRQA